MLAFSAVSVLFLYLLLRVQDKLWLALGVPKMPNHVAWNTAVSFVANTNWQAYAGESALGHLMQMAGLAVQKSRVRGAQNDDPGQLLGRLDPDHAAGAPADQRAVRADLHDRREETPGGGLAMILSLPSDGSP